MKRCLSDPGDPNKCIYLMHKSGSPKYYNVCRHRSLEPLGRQKAEIGFNRYFRCRECGAVLVVTPSGMVYQIGGSQKS